MGFVVGGGGTKVKCMGTARWMAACFPSCYIGSGSTHPKLISAPDVSVNGALSRGSDSQQKQRTVFCMRECGDLLPSSSVP